MQDPLHWGPNLLVTVTSAVEAFARCLIVDLLTKSTKQPRSGVYEQVKDANAVELILLYLSHRGLGTPRDVFGANEWRSFAQAVTKYRHLLIHECTYLNAAKLEELNRACRSVLEKVVAVAGYKEHFDKLVADSTRSYKGMTVKL